MNIFFLAIFSVIFHLLILTNISLIVGCDTSFKIIIFSSVKNHFPYGENEQVIFWMLMLGLIDRDCKQSNYLVVKKIEVGIAKENFLPSLVLTNSDFTLLNRFIVVIKSNKNFFVLFLSILIWWNEKYIFEIQFIKSDIAKTQV